MYYILIIIVIIILYFYIIHLTEGFESGTPRCPNLLIQKDGSYYLYNTKLKQVPGVNPIVFKDLNEYTTFLEWQKTQGINCPVLYLQQGYNAQGEKEYKIRPSTTELQGGLPPVSLSQQTTINAPIPENSAIIIPPSNDFLTQPQPALSNKNPPYPKEDNPNEYWLWNEPPKKKAIGKFSDPMSKYWKGAKYTQNLVDKGFYQGNEVQIYVP
jgi:hypothetical protein